MFSKFELTNDGVNLLNRVIAEKKTLKFTKFQLGKGDYEGDKKELSQLVDKFDEFNITQTNVLADGITNIRGFYDNRNLSIASKLTEIGIMAQLGDDSLTEILFSYSNQSSTDAETIPAKESYFSRTFSVMNKTDNVTSVTFDLTIRQDKYNFGTLEEMKSADYLDVGDKVTLWGETELGDTPFRMYIITDEVQDIQLINTLYAKEYFAVTNDLQNVNKNSVLNAEIVKKLAESNQGLKFDTILNIDDVGTKQEGYCYMFEGDIYKCINQTEATTPESTNFQPISNSKLSDRLDNSFRFFSENYSGQNIAFEVIWIDTDNSSSTGEIDISSFKNISKFLFANIYDGAETPQGQLSKYINIYKVANTKLYWKSDTNLLGSLRVLAIGVGN